MKITHFLLLLLCSVSLARAGAQGWRHVYTPAEAGTLSISYATAVVQTPDCGYLCLVTGSSTTPVSNGKSLFKIDKNGAYQWFKPLTVPFSYELEMNLVTLADSTYLLYSQNPPEPGHFIRIDANGNTLSAKDFPDTYIRIAAAHDNGFVTAHKNLADSKVHLVRYDLTFNALWEKTYDIPGTTWAMGDVCTGPEQTIYFATVEGNWAADSSNVRIYKLDAAGNTIWSKYLPDIEPNVGDPGLLVNADGDVFYMTNHNILPDYVTYYTTVYKFDEQGYFFWKITTTDYAENCNLMPNGKDIVLNGHRLYSLTQNTYSSLRVINPRGIQIMEGRYHPVIAGKYMFGWDAVPTYDGGFMLVGNDNFYNVFIKADSLGRIHPNYLRGVVHYDQDHDCLPDTAEAPLPNWIIAATKTNGPTWYTVTDSSGHYEFNLDPGLYAVNIQGPGPVWAPCNNGQYSADLTVPFDTVEIDMPIQDSAYCALLEVSVGHLYVRKCELAPYWVEWRNLGTADADNVTVEVVLPPELSFGSSWPIQPLVIGDTLRFEVGLLPYGGYGSVNLSLQVDCDSALLGQTLCVEGWIYPDTLCYDVPGWSGAEIFANARCLSDSTVEYSLKNVGTGSTGPLEYIITEDLVVLRTDPFNLTPGQILHTTQPFSGNFQQIIADQAPNYPFGTASTAGIETCSGSTGGLGQLLQFPLTDGSPYVDIECGEVVASYDPNDKTGYPMGYGPEHLIPANTELMYRIRFQNTGTDTAFRVVIRDSLSQYLNPASIQPGPASHPYHWGFEDGHVLVFRFDPIALPDSNVNPVGSNGFVQFRVKPKNNLPAGTRIFNSADIYFDYNLEVGTNRTVHQIGALSYTVSVQPEPENPAWPVLVAPNPFGTEAVLTLAQARPHETFTLELYDPAGRLAHTGTVVGGQYRMTAAGLLPGAYWYSIKDENGRIKARGKVMITPF